jgi:hypothetical protein
MDFLKKMNKLKSHNREMLITVSKSQSELKDIESEIRAMESELIHEKSLNNDLSHKIWNLEAE